VLPIPAAGSPAVSLGLTVQLRPASLLPTVLLERLRLELRAYRNSKFLFSQSVFLLFDPLDQVYLVFISVSP